MKVYRVESRGIGPYRSAWGNLFGIDDRLDMCYEHGNNNYPSPYLDGFSKEAQAFYNRCGFSSKEKLKKWFSIKWRYKMDKAGFKVHVYIVDSKNVYHGDSGKQVLFDPNKAKLISKISLTEI